MVLLWFVATLGVTYVANTAVGLVDLQVFPAGSRIEVLSLPRAPTTELAVPSSTQRLTTTEAPVPTTTTEVPALVSLVSDTLVLRTGGGYEERLFSGGLEPYQLEVIAGSLPVGLALNDRGALEGSPTGSGIFDATVRLTDAVGQTKENLLSFIIREYKAISARGGSVTVIVTGDSVGFFSALQANGFEPPEVLRSGPLVVEVVFPPTSGDEASWVRCEAAGTVRCAKG